MTTNELIIDFLAGEKSGKASGGRLYIKDDVHSTALVNYTTVIARLKGKTLRVTEKYYSKTTKKHINLLIKECNKFHSIDVIELTDGEV
jgi:hypothetical protein